MDTVLIRQMKGFYENELTNNILSFWLPRCLDEKHGGYFNCFDNAGEHLTSRDKYTWSQGRFVWMFAKLADMRSDTFTSEQRAEFLRLAENGAHFLREHCLIGPDDWRCVFLMDETGAPKQVEGYEELDLSIYADCFVVCGLSRFAAVSGREEDFAFARRLYRSCRERYDAGTYKTLPYPLSGEYRAHGVPMILTNVAAELFGAAGLFDAAFAESLKADIARFSGCVLNDFTDAQNVVHEVIRNSGGFFGGVLGTHANPGHTLEDMWFIAEAAEILGEGTRRERAAAIAKKALEIGWDAEFGGLMHFVSTDGGAPGIPLAEEANEPTVKQVLSGWGDKLWWVHAEALYTTLLFCLTQKDEAFLRWHRKVFAYTFSHFPNSDREVREWVQILKRDGTPQEKVVALPVKDPYHIARALILMIELLERAEAGGALAH
ncbi:MAG TPA: AGE family epimerase/isomerase [Eubacteriales bacterium]|nr:AGE family epimerase/isomerase [Eubacteriales bacterium]